MNIKKAAKMFDLSVDTLRYYERVGVIPPVHRNKSGYREYLQMILIGFIWQRIYEMRGYRSNRSLNSLNWLNYVKHRM